MQFILSKSGRTEVQTQGVRRATLPPEALEGILPFLLQLLVAHVFLDHGCIPPISTPVFTWPSSLIFPVSSVLVGYMSMDLQLSRIQDELISDPKLSYICKDFIFFQVVIFTGST